MSKVKREFHWTDDEAELLLTVTHQYKIRCIVEGTSWELVRSKYADNLKLLQAELPTTNEEKALITKDYTHLGSEVTKNILTSKLKAIRNKYRQVGLMIRY